MATKSRGKVPVVLSQGRMLMNLLRIDSKVIAALAAIVIGAFTLAPDVQVYLDQRQRIIEMEAGIAEAEADLADMQAERDRWQDPVYIRSQARDRLYYVLPGEVSYLVMNADGMDFSDTTGTLGAYLSERRNADEISQTLAAAEENWVDSLIESVFRAALDAPAESSGGSSVEPTGAPGSDLSDEELSGEELSGE
jgi:cell division protein FtsB